MLREDIGRCFREAAAVDGLGVGFWKGPGKIEHHTYASLLEEAERFASGLQELGVRSGERIALVLPTGPEFYISWFGCILARAVPVALYPPVRLGRFAEWRTRTAEMLHAASCVAVITERRLQGFLGAPVEQLDPPHGCRVPRGPHPCGGAQVACCETWVWEPRGRPLARLSKSWAAVPLLAAHCQGRGR